MKHMTKEEEVEYFKRFLSDAELAFYHNANNSHLIDYSLYGKKCCKIAMSIILESLVEKAKRLNYIAKKELNEQRKKITVKLWRTYQNEILDFKRSIRTLSIKIHTIEEMETKQK
jgi:hypothetical protein